MSKQETPEGACPPTNCSHDSITLSSSDDCFERARKILKCAGLLDGCGLGGRMAEALEAYRKMDRNAATIEANTQSPPAH